MIKTILITGASRGIGRTTAEMFNDRGWNVVATMRKPEKERELGSRDNVFVTKLDVTDAASIEKAVAAGLERFGAIDVLLNNAAFGVYGPLEAIPVDTIRRQFETNVIGVMQTTKGLLPHFRARRSGMIINMSSIGGVMAYPLGTLYHGTKWAIEGLSEALSFEMREIGVTVKIVQPGDTLTDFQVEFVNDETLAEYQEIMRKFPLGYAPIKAKGSEPSVIAEAIFTAATDGTDRLRHPAGQDSIDKVAQRRSGGDEAFMADLRRQFDL